MTAQDRARVVELWIQVAKECRVLGNYASLRAIVSALQSPSISRLQKTWGRVARKSSRKLKRFVKDQWVSRRQLVKVRRRLHIWKEGEREGRGPGRMSFGSPVT
ncbi:ral-GDS-related protein-like [Equus caballus]|uniref:ral-GDS-related protein-like n=1 Tax=Equus caballus TaxID=9796 RepID=UPI0038B28547